MRPSLGRLKKRSEYLRVARSRQKWVAPGLVLQAYRRRVEAAVAGPAEEIRVGFTASRKVGKAVERNRARRRLKAAAAEVLPAQGRPGTDYVVIARRSSLRRPYAALLGDLSTAVQRLGARDRKAGARAQRAGAAGDKPGPEPR